MTKEELIKYVEEAIINLSTDQYENVNDLKVDSCETLGVIREQLKYYIK